MFYDKRIMAALEKLTPEELIIMCEKHPELLAEFFCVKDEEYLCYKCTLKSHKDHEIKDAKDELQVEKIKSFIDVNILILESLS